MIYCRSELNTKLADYSKDNIGTFEFLSIELKFTNAKPIVVTAIYRPPSANVNMFFDEFESLVTALADPQPDLVFLGDFNIDYLNSANSNSAQFRMITQSLGLGQLISQPTRVTPTNSSCIDHIYISPPGFALEAGVSVCGLSDHDLEYVTISRKGKRAEPIKVEYVDYKHFVESDFIKGLEEIDWDFLDTIGDIDTKLSAFMSMFKFVCDQHTTVKEKLIRSKPSPWITPELKALYHQRDWTKQKALKSIGAQRDYLWLEYKQIRNKCNTKTKNAKRDYFMNIINEINPIPELFGKPLGNSILAKVALP